MQQILKIRCPLYICLVSLYSIDEPQDIEEKYLSTESNGLTLTDAIGVNDEKNTWLSDDGEKEELKTIDEQTTSKINTDGNDLWQNFVKLKNIASKSKSNIQKRFEKEKKKFLKTNEKRSIGNIKTKKKIDFGNNQHYINYQRAYVSLFQKSFSIECNTLFIDICLPSDEKIKNILSCFADIPHHCTKGDDIILYKIEYNIPAKYLHPLMRLLCSYFISRCYVHADKGLIHRTLQWEFNMKCLAVMEMTSYREQKTNILLEIAVACYIAAFSNNDLVESLKSTATSITQAAAQNTATLGLETAAQVIGNAVAGAAISAVVDVAISSATIYIAKRQKDEGRLTEEEFNTKVKKTVCESSCKLVGGTTGSIVGQVFIPVPIVGAFVGGICGSLIGAGIGKGITYGIFDRRRNKDNTEEDIDKYRLHRRKLKGFVSHITVYDEKKNCFSDKLFEKSKSKNSFFKKRNDKQVEKSVSISWELKTESKQSDGAENQEMYQTEMSDDKKHEASVLKRWQQVVTQAVTKKTDADESFINTTTSTETEKDLTTWFNVNNLKTRISVQFKSSTNVNANESKVKNGVTEKVKTDSKKMCTPKLSRLQNFHERVKIKFPEEKLNEIESADQCFNDEEKNNLKYSEKRNKQMVARQQLKGDTKTESVALQNSSLQRLKNAICKNTRTIATDNKGNLENKTNVDVVRSEIFDTEDVADLEYQQSDKVKSKTIQTDVKRCCASPVMIQKKGIISEQQTEEVRISSLMTEDIEVIKQSSKNTADVEWMAKNALQKIRQRAEIRSQKESTFLHRKRESFKKKTRMVLTLSRSGSEEKITASNSDVKKGLVRANSIDTEKSTGRMEVTFSGLRRKLRFNSQPTLASEEPCEVNDINTNYCIVKDFPKSKKTEAWKEDLFANEENTVPSIKVEKIRNDSDKIENADRLKVNEKLSVNKNIEPKQNSERNFLKRFKEFTNRINKQQ